MLGCDSALVFSHQLYIGYSFLQRSSRHFGMSVCPCLPWQWFVRRFRNLSVDSQTRLVKKHFITPGITLLCKLWIALLIAFASKHDGIGVKVVYRSVLDDLCCPIVYGILLVKYYIKARICQFHQRIVQPLPCLVMRIYRTTLHVFWNMNYPYRLVRVVRDEFFNQQSFRW